MEMIIYDSRANTGTTKHFAKQLSKVFGIQAISVQEVMNYKVNVKAYVLCTYTIDYGAVPEDTQKFLKAHSSKMIAVVANGSSNFRKMGLFGRAGDKISSQYDVELLARLDVGGTKEDLRNVAERLEVMTGQSMKVADVLHVRPQSKFVNGRFQLHSLT